jgi:hypothetical protein
VARVRLTPSARRLRALMDVLGFVGRGAQTRFAKEIGVARSRINNVLIDQPLSRQLAEKLFAVIRASRRTSSCWAGLEGS